MIWFNFKSYLKNQTGVVYVKESIFGHFLSLKKKKKTEREKKRLRVDEESRRLVGTSAQCSEDV